uniref:Uncharacterized protein n=1 Tax=Moniliophthora roreri TaxID=221103 RepID=A0A0W0FU16_MONRR
MSTIASTAFIIVTQSSYFHHREESQTLTIITT